MEHVLSIFRSEWTFIQKDTWLDEAAWRRVVEAAPDLEPIDQIVTLDPTRQCLATISRPGSAKWLGHPSGLVYVFMLYVGRLEVGVLCPGAAGTTFTLDIVDEPLFAEIEAIARLLDADIQQTITNRGRSAQSGH